MQAPTGSDARRWAAILIAIGGCALLGVSVWRMLPRHPATDGHARTPDAEPVSPGADARAIADAAERRRIRDRVADAPTRLPPAASAGALADAVDATLAAYASPGPERFVALLEARGVAPPDALTPEADPARAATLWDPIARLARSARVDAAGVRVLPGPLGPQVVSESRSTRTAARDDARPLLRRRPAPPRVHVELPVVFTPEGDPPFGATLVLEYALDESAGAWVLTRTRLRDAPTGLFIPTFPV